MDTPSSRLRRSTAPGHPVKYFLHRSSLDLGPSYRNFAHWQFDKAKTLYRKNLLAHFGCVNAIEFSKNGKLLVSGGDDRRVLLWNVDKAVVSQEKPTIMQAEHLSNVFSLDFSCSSEKIFSAGNDDQVIVHDIATCAPLDYFVHEQPVYGISADPITDSVFCSACDDGRILIFDIRDSANEPFCVAKATSAFHSVMFHPIEPRLLVTANSKEGVCSWDVRMPKRVLVKYGVQNSSQCCMNARFNRLGNQILVLRRRLPPILYSTDSPLHLYQFNHRGYYNSCTMKSCSFGGLDDQYVLSGSDNFDLHLWKIPPPGSDQWVNKADMVLRGHRSIVNQVRFNYAHNLIASSGVEKIVKLWSPFPLPDELGGKSPAVVVNESERRIFTPDDYVHLVMQAGHGQFMSLTYEAGRKTTREDSRMLAFFDALVQRDINGMSSEESDDLPETSYTNTVYTSPETTSSENEDEDSNPPSFRSLLSAEQNAANSRVSLHNVVQSVPVDNSSTLSSTNNDDEDANHNGRAQSEDSEELSTVNISSIRQGSSNQNAQVDETAQPTEDRDMTANKITQLILQKEKESNRRKLLSKTTRRTSSNHGRSSETPSDSEADTADEEVSTASHNSSSRPLRLSTESSRRKSTTSSYSSSRKEFRKQLLRARRREMLSAPVYDSSRNATNSHSSTVSSLETSLDRISELMTRNQTSQEMSDSSENSSSSSSSDSSSSDELSSSKGKKKSVTSTVKSREILSTDTSSSESESASRSSAISSNPILRNEVNVDSSIPHSSNGGKELKIRKRRHPCKLNEACKALFKRYVDPEFDSQRLHEGTIPFKRLRLQMSESVSTSSTEVADGGGGAELVSFKKITKQKERNYRKSSTSAELNTPPDSGIDVSKEQEPCCSKSCSKSEDVKLPDEIDKSEHKKDLDIDNADDLGFGQLDSEDSE